ncbi:MAG: hypothetical protein WC479_03425 [Candidatus Izemoplasmatales bacterium]
MTPIRALLSVSLHENFNLKRLLGRNASKSKKTTVFIVIALLYALGAFLVSFGYMFMELGNILSQNNAIEILLMFVFFYATIMTVLYTLFRANGSLFHCKDYDIIAPMPFSPIQIVTVKLIIMMINLYISVLVMISPILFAYVWYATPGFLNILFLIVTFFFIPLIPVVICSFLSMIIARLASLFRKSNLVNIILMFLIFVGIMVLSFSYSFSGQANLFIGQIDLMEIMGKIYMPMKWFAQAIHQNNILSFVFYVISSAIPFALFVVLLSKMIVKTNSLTIVTHTSGKSKPIVYVQKGIYKTLITKEFRKFFNVPVYALNSGIGMVMLFLAAIASLVFSDYVAQYLGLMTTIGMPFELLILIFICFCTSTVYTSAITISLEGKNFWILRSMPILPNTIVRAKLFFNIILSVPIILLSIILFAIAFKIDLLMMVIMILVASSFAVLTSVIGTIINLYLPKFDYINETEIVKQSAAALLALFSGFAIIVIDGLLYFGLSQLLPIEITLILIVIFNGLIAMSGFWWVTKVTENLFIKFPA